MGKQASFLIFKIFLDFNSFSIRQDGPPALPDLSFVSEAEEALEDPQKLADISSDTLTPPEGVLHDFKQVLETIGEEEGEEKPVTSSPKKKEQSQDEKENKTLTPKNRESKNRGGIIKNSVAKNLASDVLFENNPIHTCDYV